MTAASSDKTCSFCGKSQRVVRALIEGPSVYICNECIALCVSILATGAGLKIDEVAAAALELDEVAALMARVRARAAGESVSKPGAEGGLPFHCSFCGQPRDQVAKLISGPRVFICEACIEIAFRVTREASD